MSAKNTDTKTGSKSSIKPAVRKGKLLYHSREEVKKRVGENPTDVVEKSVTHAEDNLFCKFYEKKNGVATKISVKSGGKGGEYIYSIKKGDAETKTSTHAKKDLIKVLKEHPQLAFMVEYIESEKSLARSKSKSKTKSKSKPKVTKTKSKSKSRSHSRPKAKVVKSKSKSKSKSKPVTKPMSKSVSKPMSKPKVMKSAGKR